MLIHNFVNKYGGLLKLAKRENLENNRMYFLNLSDPSEFECMAEQFGGQEHIKMEYPIFWDKMQRTREMHRKNGVNRTPLKKGDLEELLYVYDMHVTDKGMLFGAGAATLLDPAAQICASVSLYQGDQCIGHNADFSCASRRASVACTSDEKWKKGASKTIVHLAWQRPNDNFLTAAIVVYEETELYEDPIASVEVEHPSVSNSFFPPTPIKERQAAYQEPGRQYVNICYARAPESGERCHYYYSQGLKDGKQEIYLDVRGDVILKGKGGETREIFESVKNVFLHLDTPYGGVLAKEIENLASYVYATANGFRFAFPTDWGVKIPGGVLAAREICYLDCRIEYYIRGDEKLKKLNIGSRISSSQEENEHWTKIPDIKLNWGCVAKDTQILMADYSTRRISDIRRGDRIMGGKTGRPVTVLDVIYGNESILWCVKGINGENIYMSSEHPVVTREGDKMAVDLMETDSIQKEDGIFTPVEFRYDKYYGDIVYNMILENDHYFIANGYIIGDMEIQGSIMRKSIEREYNTPEHIVKEVEKMRSQLHKE